MRISKYIEITKCLECGLDKRCIVDSFTTAHSRVLFMIGENEEKLKEFLEEFPQLFLEVHECCGVL